MARLGYLPALDGLRALAVIAVLFFHGEMGASGGFLGVSLFFTLSGYLITRLLLAEHASTGGISIRDFYGRRLRRLMPAAFLCFALVLALGGLWSSSQRRDLPGDLLASMLDVANWRFAFAGTSYRDLFLGSSSPVAHFWSLAIEEQFYVVLPLVALVTLRRSRRTFALTAWLLLALSILATVLTTDRDLVYNGTHTRAAELLLGVVLAVLPVRRRAVQRVLRVASPVAAALLIVLVLKATVSDGWLYDGGLIGVGICSAVLIAGVAHGGPLAMVLATPALAAIGRVSYGLYLFHWPLFLVLTEERLGFGGLALFAVRIAASSIAALASYRLVEQPIRLRRRFPLPHQASYAALGTLAVLLVAARVAIPHPNLTETEALIEQGAAAEVIVLTPTGADGGTRLLSDEAEAALGVGLGPSTSVRPSSSLPPSMTSTTDATDDEDVASSTAPPAPTDEPETTVATTAPPSPAPTRVLVVGSDESPLAHLAARGYEVIDGVQRGCPIATAVEVMLEDGTTLSTETCTPSWIHWAERIREAAPDVIVISAGAIDRGVTRRFGEPFPAPLDLIAESRRLDAEEADLRAAVEIATQSGADVWVVDHRGDRPKGLFDERLARLGLTERSVRAVVASDEALVRSIDTALNAVLEVRTLRVLVIGDSVSLNFARSLADAIPGTLDVVWAGENGCPFVRARATRVTSNAEWEVNRCQPFDEKLPPLLDEFQPDVVVMMVSLRELAEQLYAGDDDAHVVGDEEYTAFHDAEMAELVALLEPRGVPLLVTDAPPINAGAMASNEMADPSRIAAWNAQIQRWVDAWPSVDLLPYTAPLLAFEAENGSVRADGVHPEIDPLTAIAREVFVPAVIQQSRALQAAMPRS